MGEGSKGQVAGSELLGLGSERKSEGRPYLAGGRFSKKSGGLLGLVLASLCPKGWASSVQVFIDRVDLYAPGAETRCSAVWSAHLFWVQRAIGSNPVTSNVANCKIFME